MKKVVAMKSVMILAMALMFCSSALWASGSSYSAVTAAPATDPTQVTETIKCRVTAVEDIGRVKIQDSKTEEEAWILIDSTTRLIAQDKKAFEGRKKLNVEADKFSKSAREKISAAGGAVNEVKASA